MTAENKLWRRALCFMEASKSGRMEKISEKTIMRGSKYENLLITNAERPIPKKA